MIPSSRRAFVTALIQGFWRPLEARFFDTSLPYRLRECLDALKRRRRFFLDGDFDLDEIKRLLSNKGETEINLVIKDKNKQALISLQENRKFDLEHHKALKAKKYVEKITV